MTNVDQYYQDAAGGLHFLSAEDQTNAVALGLKLPDPAWTPITSAQALSIINPAIPLAAAQAAAIAECIAYANTLTASIINQYPQAEVDSWPAQLIEARLVQAGQTLPAPSLLQDQVTAANNPAVTLQTCAAAVITNATAYQQIVGMVQALRRTAQTQISATTDASQIPAVLAVLKAQADAAAKQYGLIL